ncbi:tol-pal system protein [Bartonella vinsonii]|nr:tol-pal system protein [Bartonella vinsonii]
MCCKKNWKTLFCMAVLIACFTSSAQSAARKASQYSPSDKAVEAEKEVAPAAEKASEAVKEVAPAAEKASEVEKEVAPAAEKASEAEKEVAPAAEKASEAEKEVAPAAEKASEAVKEVAPAAEKASEAEKEVAPAAEKASEAVKEVAPAAEKASEAVKEVAPAAEKASEAVKEVAPAAEKASEAVKEVAPAAEKASEAVKEVAPAAEKASEAVKEVAPAAEKASEAVKEVAPAAEKASEAVKEVAPAAEKASEAVKEVAPAAEKASEVEKEVAPAAEKASEAVEEVAPAAEKASEVEKASEAVKEVAPAADEGPSFQGMIQSREFILQNQKDFFKDYDLDKLLQRIRTVLEHHDLKNVEKQFHQLFDKKDSSVYSCAAESAALDENVQIAKEGMLQEQNTKEVQDSGAKDRMTHVENYESRLQGIYGHGQKTDENLKEEHKDAKEAGKRLEESRLEKIHEQGERFDSHHGEDSSLLSAKELYKKGYNLLLSANYVDAEKAFCTFQQHYKKDPLRDDALFWLAEALLGQKRYHEAAQVYLNAWYTDKKELYSSEILLKLAISMVALDQNKEACTLAAKQSKETLESIFCKPVKRSGVGHGGH